MNPELLSLLNMALEMEHAAAIQYYTHAQLITGPDSGPIIALLEDSAKDEEAHAVKLRTHLNVLHHVSAQGVVTASVLCPRAISGVAANIAAAGGTPCTWHEFITLLDWPGVVL